MKTKLLLLGFLIIGIASCTIRDENKTIVVIPNELSDTLRVNVDVNPKKVIVIPEHEKELIDSFRPPIRDVAYYALSHQKHFKLDKWRFWIDEGKYGFWVANGWNSFRLTHPGEYNLTETEKKYFWNIYQNYRDNQKLYDWENDLKIVVK